MSILNNNADFTLAIGLHQAKNELNVIEEEIRDKIIALFSKYESNLLDVGFSIGSDYYDNSIEIYLDDDFPSYPYEPCFAIRNGVYEMGFSIVYWNFFDRDEVRGYEPRHYKDSHKEGLGWLLSKYGYVDNRFNIEEYESNFRNKQVPIKK